MLCVWRLWCALFMCCVATPAVAVHSVSRGLAMQHIDHTASSPRHASPCLADELAALRAQLESDQRLLIQFAEEKVQLAVQVRGCALPLRRCGARRCAAGQLDRAAGGWRARVAGVVCSMVLMPSGQCVAQNGTMYLLPCGSLVLLAPQGYDLLEQHLAQADLDIVHLEAVVSPAVRMGPFPCHTPALPCAQGRRKGWRPLLNGVLPSGVRIHSHPNRPSSACAASGDGHGHGGAVHGGPRLQVGAMGGLCAALHCTALHCCHPCCCPARPILCCSNAPHTAHGTACSYSSLPACPPARPLRSGGTFEDPAPKRAGSRLRDVPSFDSFEQAQPEAPKRECVALVGWVVGRAFGTRAGGQAGHRAMPARCGRHGCCWGCSCMHRARLGSPLLQPTALMPLFPLPFLIVSALQLARPPSPSTCPARFRGLRGRLRAARRRRRESTRWALGRQQCPSGRPPQRLVRLPRPCRSQQCSR